MYNNSIQPEVIDIQSANPFTASIPSSSGYITHAKIIGPDGIERIGYGPKARELKTIRERMKVNINLWKFAVEKLLTQNK